MTTRTRFFQIGFNRAGTSSLAEMIARFGLNVAHHSVDRDGTMVNIALAMADNIESGRRPLNGFDDIDAFTDIEYTSAERIVEGNRFFRDIMVAYPEMKFILNLRRKEDWLKSRLNFNDYPHRCMVFYGVDRDGLVALWSEHWDMHIADVQAEIPADRLLIMDIDNPNKANTAAFFGLNPDTIDFRQRNKSANGPFAKMAYKILPRWVYRFVPNQLKNALKDF